MKNYQKILLILALGLVFILVYSPHFDYNFPFHVDEWNHIGNAKFLESGAIFSTDTPAEFSPHIAGITPEFGFHVFLLILSKIFNLVLIYKFLPAIWSVFSAFVLFWLVYKKTSKNFFIAILAVIFFASIKSNVNLTGLWFFTPLTFSIPFIFLYVYFFTEGLEKQNKKFILISLGIMAFLIPIHSISVLFALPFLFIYSLFYFNYLKQEYKFFSLFLIIPLFGILFYKYVHGIPWPELVSHLINALQFKHGWGVLELKNSFTEIYSEMGYLLAMAGALFIMLLEKDRKKYIPYLIWPLISLIMIIIYRISDISYLVPYQRNLYYLAISLPFLSAFGLYYFLVLIKDRINKLNLQENYKFYFQKIISGTIIFLVIVLLFIPYYDIPGQVDLYRVIDDENYKALTFLSTLPRGRVVADSFISTAIYPIAGQNIVATIAFYGAENTRQFLIWFMATNDCEARKNIILKSGPKYNYKYVFSKFSIDCGWEIIYQGNNNYIYKMNYE